MLDIRAIRENPDALKERLATKSAEAAGLIDEVLAGGVIGLGVILSRGLAGQFTKKHHVAVEAVHYYWHFVDVVWVLLFVLLYVMK